MTRLFAALLAREITMTLRYRTWIALMQLSALIGPAIALLVWHDRDPALTAYLLLVSVVGLLSSSWTATFLATSIRLGTVNSWLVRPCSTHLASLANNVAEKLVKLPVAVVPAVVLYRHVALPRDARTWLLFTLSLLLAAAIAFALDILIGSLAFWFEDISAVERVRNLLARTLSGALVPLSLFPPSPLLALQPFRYIVSLPLEILLGPAGAADIAVQAAWCAAAIAGAAVVWRRGLRNYQGAGA